MEKKKTIRKRCHSCRFAEEQGKTNDGITCYSCHSRGRMGAYYTNTKESNFGFVGHPFDDFVLFYESCKFWKEKQP